MVLAAALAAVGGEVEDALAATRAPGGEFVRMPAKYVIEKLEDTARNSGEPVLGGFSVEARMEGADAKRININMESMTLLAALEAVASATGARLDFESTSAVLADPASTPLNAEPETAAVQTIAPDPDDAEPIGFSDVDNALVFVSTGVGRGSAFVAEMDGKIYVLSNQHNFMGANKLELRAMHGGLLEFESFEFSRTRDLVRFELSDESAAGLGVLRLSNIAPTIGQEVVVYGNSAGGNVATELRGEVLGVGPRDIEVDAEIVSGNSGSPILDTSGAVIGVATYVSFETKFEKNDARKEIFKGTRFGKTRRYGVRIPADGWARVDLRAFLSQTYRLSDWKNRLEIMTVLVEYWGGLDDYEDYEVAAKTIMAAYSTRAGQVERPYEFHSAAAEAEIEMMVKAFARNYDEFVAMMREMDPDRRELAAMSAAQKSGKSPSKAERVDYYIRTSTLSKAKALREELERQEWMSQYMRDAADPLNKMASDLVLKLEGKKDVLPRAKAVL